MKTNELHFSGMQKSAKERKRVRKSVKRKGIVGGEWRRKGSPPHYMHDCQKKGLTKWAIRK
jgi:hypothetical protein